MKNKYIKILLLSTPMLLSCASANASGFNFERMQDDFYLRIHCATNPKKEYINLARQHHTDKGGDKETFQALNNAWTDYHDNPSIRALKAESIRRRQEADRTAREREEAKRTARERQEADRTRQQAAEAVKIAKENEAKKFSTRSQTVGGAFNDFLHGTSNIFEARSIPVASGDDNTSEDKVWVKGFGGIGKDRGIQHSTNQHYGATIGVDFQTEENNMLGFAYTSGEAKSIIKNSDNIKATVNIASIYGATTPNNSKLFVLGHVSYGQASISGLTSKNSKHKADLLNTKVSLGYKFHLEDSLTLTPKIGLAYNIINIQSSKAKMLKENKKNFEIAGLTTDLSLSLAKEINATYGLITPEIHAGISYGEKSVTESQIGKLNKSSKKEQLSYNIGASVKAVNASNVDIMIGYDCNFSKKYIGHNGFAKLTFKF